MNKKIIIGLVGVLFLIVFSIFLLSAKNKEKTSQQTKNQESKSTNLSTSNEAVIPTTTLTTIENNANFKVDYSTQNNKYVVTKKTTAADQKIDDWLTQNNLSTAANSVQIVDQSNTSELAANPEINQTVTNPIPSIILISPTITDDSTYKNNSKVLVDLLSIFINNNTTTITPSVNPSSVLNVSPTKKKPSSSSKPAGKFVYYAQCGGGFDSYPLPSGCTVCQAGCGPTSVAMIAASYVDKNITPKTVVDLYKQKGYFLGCAGSRATDAKAALGSYGVKTTDFMTFSSATIDVAAKDFKNYMNSGWTIFVLTYFCDGGCGHFFWLTEIGSNNTAWAYDPYYGKGQTPPINENTRYPFPKYRMAFGVKK